SASPSQFTQWGQLHPTAESPHCSRPLPDPSASELVKCSKTPSSPSEERTPRRRDSKSERKHCFANRGRATIAPPHSKTSRPVLHCSKCRRLASSTRKTQPTPPLPESSNPAKVAPLSSLRKSTRLNSSHVKISYAVFCLKKKI